MIKVTVEEVDKLLDARLSSTNSLYISLNDESDVNYEKNVFTNYYLDFSSGIEYLIRHILRIKYEADKFVLKKIQVEESNSPKFYECKEVLNLIENDFPDVTWREFKTFCKLKCTNIKENDFSNKPNNTKITADDFFSRYDNARKNRNLLAHGFELKGMTFSKKIMIDFCFSYFILYKVYIKLS